MPNPAETSVASKLMNDEYRHARQKAIKIYTDREIKYAKSEMEKARREFWNRKAEQLSKNSKIANQGKSAIIGIIDVAWTLRKTRLIEDDARKLEQDEHDLFDQKDSTLSGRGKQQKASTIGHNLQRMKSAHERVMETDKKMESIKQKQSKAKTGEEKKKANEEYKRMKAKLDGQYTELKRAQDALQKSLKHKRELINARLKKGT